jgi:hypothetical protein
VKALFRWGRRSRRERSFQASGVDQCKCPEQVRSCVYSPWFDGVSVLVLRSGAPGQSAGRRENGQRRAEDLLNSGRARCYGRSAEARQRCHHRRRPAMPRYVVPATTALFPMTDAVPTYYWDVWVDMTADPPDVAGSQGFHAVFARREGEGYLYRHATSKADGCVDRTISEGMDRCLARERQAAVDHSEAMAALVRRRHAARLHARSLDPTFVGPLLFALGLTAPHPERLLRVLGHDFAP